MLSIFENAFGHFAARNYLSLTHRCSVGSDATVGRSGGEVTSNGVSFHQQQAETCSAAPSQNQENSVVDIRRTEQTSDMSLKGSSGVLSLLLSLDEHITTSIGLCFSHPTTTLQHTVRGCCKVLEISGHGVPWFSTCFVLFVLYLFTNFTIYLHYGLNMLFLLVIDILIVAPIKLIFKRPRPHLNTGAIPLSVSQIDQYAFPSGHASRCVALAAYFCYMPPFNPWTHLWYIWGMLVSLSRIALGRHHILDVGAGMLAGLFIFEIVQYSDLLLGT